MIKNNLIALLITFLSAYTANAYDLTKSDSRIKTFVYDENDIHEITVEPGFQTIFEFGLGEEIEVMSSGIPDAWKLTPIGRRLILKPLKADLRTNMVIITNKRSYNFDIIIKDNDKISDDEVAYIVRFYYPPTKNSKK